MKGDTGAESLKVTPSLPRSIWVLAWASLAQQVLLVVRHGGRVDDEASQIVSMVLGAFFVGYVSAGVVRARRVRIVLAWVVLTLGVIGGLFDLIWAEDLGQTTHAVFVFAAGAVSLAALVMFRRSEWYVWQRTRPSIREGASIGQLVAIGVLVGVMGGYVGQVDSEVGMHFQMDL